MTHISATLKLKMDRPFELNTHYISPGGYEVTMTDGSRVKFDFLTSDIHPDENDSRIVTFALSNLDTNIYDFPDATRLYGHSRDIASLSECFVYTGEACDPKISVRRILSFIMFDDDSCYNIKIAKNCLSV